jgi:SH3 domain protein
LKKNIIFLLVLLLPLLVEAAEVRYVSDELKITLRTGQGSQYQILKTLPSGSRVELLETGEEGYSLVRTDDDIEGWVLTRFLVDTPIARDQLAAALQKQERLIAQNSQFKQEQADLKKQNADLSSELQKLKSDQQSTDQELEKLKQVAAKPILLDQQNQDLKQQNVSLEKELQLVQQENQVLRNRANRDWFIAGAGVLLGGMLLGLFIPKLRWRKKSNW